MLLSVRLLLVVLVSVGLLSSGCSDPAPPSAAAGGVSSTSARASNPTTAAPDRAPPRRRRAPSPSALPTPPTQTAAPASRPAAPCRARDLGSVTFTSDVTTDATGSFDDGGTGLTDFVLTNTSGRACQVGGWVGFTLRGDATVDACVAGQPPTDPPCGGVVDQDTALDQDIRRADGDTSPVVLDPGASTSFRATSSDATLCLERPYRVELVLAVGDEPIYVVLTDSVLCAARPVLLTPLAAT